MTHNPAEALREAANTDREIWRGPDSGNGEYYADRIFVTVSGAIGIDCGGTVVVLPPREWQRAALTSPAPAGGEDKPKPCPFCGGAPFSEIMDGHHLISCSDVECFAHPVVIVGKTEAIALSRWNKRAPDGAELGRQFSQALNHYLAENAPPPRLPVLPLEVALSEENDQLIADKTRMEAEIKRLQNALKPLEALNELRSDEGSSVTLLCDNPDFNGQPNNAVICNGEWTNWEDRRFADDTIGEAIRAALDAFRRARTALTPKEKA